MLLLLFNWFRRAAGGTANVTRIVADVRFRPAAFTATVSFEP